MLLLSATTELFIINLVPQHDPQADPQLACYRHARFPQTFPNQFATIETLQLRIAVYRMSPGFTPKEPQQPTALLGHPTEPLRSSAGVFPRDHLSRHRLSGTDSIRVLTSPEVGGLQ